MISVLIPAYNNPTLLFRQLDSLSKQTIYDDLEIIVSDDCSPIILKDDEIFETIKKNINIKWYRQDKNLGVVGNLKFLYSLASFKYIVFAQHDDFYIDNNYFSRALLSFSKYNDLGFIFSNSYFEGSNNLFFKFTTKVISGNYFSYLFLNKLNTSWSSVIFDKSKLDFCGGFASFYMLTDQQGVEFSTYPHEEGMGFLYLLSIHNNVLIESNPVCIRGLPPSRFSISENHPGRNIKNDILFFNYLNIAKYLSRINFNGKLISIAILYTSLTNFGLNYLNRSIINFVGNNFAGIFYIILSLISNRILYLIWYCKHKYYTIRHIAAKIIKPFLNWLKMF